MGLFKYLDSITPKIYILSLGNEITHAKIGYTKKEIEKRIKDYKFSGKWKGKESEIKIHAIFENPKAEAIEGYTEWYNCQPTKIQSCVALAIRYLERDKKE